MAKPVYEAKLKPRMRAGKAASRVLTAKIANVREHAPNALLGDVEGIHDMRVSVKRLREAMRLFRRLLPQKRRDAMMPVVELLNDTLGAVRERDVMILDAEKLAEEAGDDGGLCSLAVAQWRTERAVAFEHLVKVWAQMCSEGLFPALEEIASRTAKRGRKSNKAPLERFVYRAVTRALERVHERLGPALESADPAPMHRLRIGVKRLRYSMEPFRDVLPALVEPCKTAADAQELLGLTHDLDVLRDALAGHLDEVAPDRREVAERLLGGLDVRREESAQRAHEVAEQFADPEFDRAILDAID